MISEIDLPRLPQPFSATEFLEWMGADSPGLYLLGSLNRHITVHSQQCRAINLIHALQQEDGLHGKAVAIVGAGFAGLTAAAFALEHTTAHVTLFDASPRPLWLQDRCANRWLHPGIYDWPYPGSLEPSTALPVLNWRAGAAEDVAAQIRAEWERIAATKGLLRLQLETKISAVTSADGQLLINLPGGEQQAFDIVVLAIGFGLERGGLGHVGYWNDADGLDGIAKGSSVLVSGFGDGGIADVLRLCLPDKRQDSLIELVRHVPANIRRQLIESDERFWGNNEALEEFYGQLRVEKIIQYLLDSAPPLARVTLVGKGHLYGTGSAILNRFLISQLRQARGEEAFELVKGSVVPESLTELSDGRSRIRLADSGEEREFDHVALRWGPQPAYKDISPLFDWKVGEERRRHWYEMPQSLDRTRVPLWGESEISNLPEGRRQDFLAYESSSSRWCLILSPPNSTIEWAVHLRHALEKERQHIPNLNVDPLVLCSKDAVFDQAAIRSAVRALCAADIVIADVTRYDPSLLLLLGIRAAVRRSVTIACTQEALTPEFLQELPFNLKELNLVSFDREEDGYRDLRATLRAGLTQSGVSSRYLDLPVYDYIREEQTDEGSADHRRVLLLRAFTPYAVARKIHVQDRIREGLGFHEEARVESVIDQASPRLAGQRLYEAIRHWKICVVDLTWWRPNVMFELGVRLAVRSSGTFCLIDKTVEGDATFEGSRAELKDFLHPFSYDLSTSSLLGAFASSDSDYNPVYEAAARHFRTGQDHFDDQVDTLLVAAAAVTPGHEDPLQAVDITPLYARDNSTYGKEIRHSVFERLCAAWYYLAEREEPHLVRPIDLLDRRRAAVFRRFRRLGSRLKTALAHRYGLHDKRLQHRIEEAEKSARDSGALKIADLLDAWKEFRVDPPWQINSAAIKDNEWADLIEEWEEQGQKLSELEDLLAQLASPVCELPLQGVRSDQRRVKIVVERFKRRT
jgi:hypothetical protein